MKRARFPTRKILVVSPAQLNTAVAVLKTVPVDAANPIEIRIGEQAKGRNKDQNALMCFSNTVNLDVTGTFAPVMAGAVKSQGDHSAVHGASHRQDRGAQHGTRTV